MNDIARENTPRPDWIRPAFVVVLAVAAWFRFADLNLRPFHHDEGVNGFFLTNLLREGKYRYDPSNYHGPSLYYLSLPAVAVLGLTPEAVRGTVALFGTLIVGGLLQLLRRESAPFALIAAALFALSPGATYFARYFIHETLFVSFTLGLVLTSSHWPSSSSGRTAAFSVIAGLFFATKETHFVSAGALAGAAFMASWLVRREPPWRRLKRLARATASRPEMWIGGLALFVFVSALLYTSIFKNPRGAIDAFMTLAFWTKTAVRDHAGSWRQHIDWMREADPVLFYAGVIGALIAIVRRRSYFATLAAFWFFALLFAYSLVRYKTPWLNLNMLLPLAITAGCLLADIGGAFATGRTAAWRAPFAAFVAAALGATSARESFDLQFVRYDREDHAYIYAHTQRDFLRAVTLIETRARALPKGLGSSVAVFAPENWPLPWYLRNFSAAAYWGEFKPDIEADIYVCSTGQDAAVDKKAGSAYERFGPFHMRGDVYLYVYARTP